MYKSVLVHIACRIQYLYFHIMTTVKTDLSKKTYNYINYAR